MCKKTAGSLSFVLFLVAGEVLAESEAAKGLVTLELAASVVAEVGQEVERLRGLAFKQPVPVEVVDDESARGHMLARLEKFESFDQLRHTGTAYQLLGLLPDDVDLLELLLKTIQEQAAGFYDPGAQVFYLLDDMPAALAETVTAHELTHALEDQHFDLDERLTAVLEDDDRSFALGAVHEGSATLIMTQYAAGAMMRGELDLESMTAMARMEEEQAALIADMPPVMLRQLLGPYMLGMLFLTRGDMVGGLMNGFPQDDVAHVFTDGPLSSEQILYPYKYWDPERRDDPLPVALEDAGSLLGRRWQKSAEGVLGEITLALMVGAETPSDPQSLLLKGGAAWTNEASRGWGGDRWQLWTRGEQHVAILSTVWDSTEDAVEFSEALPERRNFVWRRNEERVAVVVGLGGKKAGKLLDGLTAAPAK